MFHGQMTTAPDDLARIEVAPIRPLQHLAWKRLPALRGGGAVLVGPHERGVQAIVPPGVVLRHPDGWDPGSSCRGWRLAVWGLDDAGMSLIDARLPIDVQAVRLADVLRLAPQQHRSWVLATVRRQLLALGGACRRARAAGASQGAVGGAARRRLDELSAELADALGHPDPAALERHILDGAEGEPSSGIYTLARLTRTIPRSAATVALAEHAKPAASQPQVGRRLHSSELRRD